MSEWKEIAADNLPKSGDEVFRVNKSWGNIMKYGRYEVLNVEALCDFPHLEYADYVGNGWMLFRPIDVPEFAAKQKPRP